MKHKNYLLSVLNLGSRGVQLVLNGKLQAQGFATQEKNLFWFRKQYWSIQVGVAYRKGDDCFLWRRYLWTNKPYALNSEGMGEALDQEINKALTEYRAEGNADEDILTLYYFAVPTKQVSEADLDCTRLLDDIGTWQDLRTPKEMSKLRKQGYQELAQIPPLAVIETPQDKAAWTALSAHGITHWGDYFELSLKQKLNTLKGISDKRADRLFELYDKVVSQNLIVLPHLYEFELYYGRQNMVESERQLRRQQNET